MQVLQFIGLVIYLLFSKKHLLLTCFYCPGGRRPVEHRCVTPLYGIPMWIFDCVLEWNHVVRIAAF